MTEITWRTGLSEADRRRIADLFTAAEARDGVAPVGDQVHRELSRDHSRHLLAENGGDLIGFLDLAPPADDAPAMAEAVVHPDARRRGIGTELIRTGLAEGGRGARVWAHGNLAAARATAGALGLTVVRELLQMRRPLSGLPPAAMPSGVRLRSYAGSQDDQELLRVNNLAFSWHPEQGGWTAADIAQRRGESWFDPAGLFLAFDDSDGRSGPLLGFHWTKVHSRELGEVYVVGVDPDAQGRGLGKALTLVGLHHLAGRLAANAAVMLYVEGDNVAAVTTYERLDFAVVATDVAYAAAGAN